MIEAKKSEADVILLLAHGTADSVEDIPEFLRNVTGGRPVPPQVMQEVKHRYSLIGHSPMNEITARQGELLARELGIPVYVGMRNWNPLIADVVKKMESDGVRSAIAIGTPMKVPNRPHRKVQKKIANSTMTGEIDNMVPATRGSI